MNFYSFNGDCLAFEFLVLIPEKLEIDDLSV